MRNPFHTTTAPLAALTILGLAAMLTFPSCSSLPGSKGTQGAVAGGVGGAAVGALLADENNRALGAVIGGALGAGGGYLVGHSMENNDDNSNNNNNNAQTQDPNPSEITKADVANSDTADLDHDGNVTVAELVAMDQAGLSDQEIINRLQRTNVVFHLTPQQKQMLIDRGISQNVVAQLETINTGQQPIGTPAQPNR